MLKKTITYKDLDGNDITEDFYFNLTKAELVEMELGTPGGLKDYFVKIVGDQDGYRIMEAFKDIIKRSYGRRSDDNKSFIKRPEFTESFMGSDAWSVIFLELVTNADAGAQFVNGVMPKDMVDAAAKEAQKTGNTGASVNMSVLDEQPAYVRENRDPTPAEIRAMTQQELVKAMEWRTTKGKTT